MASVLKTAAADIPALPFQRGTRTSMAARTSHIRLQPRALRSA
jgi:hypothetical protein